MVGDSIHDANVAKQLGIDFIGVTNGYGFKIKEEVERYSPIGVAKKAIEIMGYLY